jgi:hypothetical protein
MIDTKKLTELYDHGLSQRSPFPPEEYAALLVYDFGYEKGYNAAVEQFERWKREWGVIK